MECSIDFACIGCNRTTGALAWGNCGLVAYAACNSVVIYVPRLNQSVGKVISILNGHTARVNCVQWMGDGNETDDNCILQLVSGSCDNNIILWERFKGSWYSKQVLMGHTKMICSLSSILYRGIGQTPIALLVSSSADCSLKLWRRNEDASFQCLQTVSLGSGFVHTSAISSLPHSEDVILACGCDDTTVRLYVLQESTLELVLSLKGHKNSIRCLQVVTISNGDELLLASASQDHYIRLWKIKTAQPFASNKEDGMLALKEQSFTTVCGKEYSVILESVLIGHEGWVLGLSWNCISSDTPILLSASMDRTMIVWEYDDENKVWVDTARMGEVGGNTLGYYGCSFGPSGRNIIAHGYHSAFQMWSKVLTEGSSKWSPEITISGHFGEVEDFDWDPEGEFVITASTDQSTRLFAQWKREGYEKTWHEIARPQVHGYDMKSIVMLDRFKYASGAQEKVIRIFSAPQSFHNTFSNITGVENVQDDADLPVGATVPVLGLSNKAVFRDDIQTWSIPTEASNPKKSPFIDEPIIFKPSFITEPPVEDMLVQNTLWPEVQKLYGHGFEIFSLASTSDGKVLASTCKATKQEFSEILIWDTSSWKVVDQLSAHSLTVTQLCFSDTGKYLLSVSRDRTWAVHSRSDDSNKKYLFVQKTEKTNCIHSRIIWACDWLNGDSFITVSRDKKAIVWDGVGIEDISCKDVLNVGEPATAVSARNMNTIVDTRSQEYLVAIGLESGGVHVYRLTFANSTWASILQQMIPNEMCPALQVKRLRWRNIIQKNLQLGVCSSDHSFRILCLKFLP